MSEWIFSIILLWWRVYVWQLLLHKFIGCCQDFITSMKSSFPKINHKTKKEKPTKLLVRYFYFNEVDTLRSWGCRKWTSNVKHGNWCFSFMIVLDMVWKNHALSNIQRGDKTKKHRRKTMNLKTQKHIKENLKHGSMTLFLICVSIQPSNLC